MDEPASTVITKVIKIGNSQGVLIPNALIEKYALHSEILLSVKNGSLTIRPVEHPVKPVEHPREGWAESFKEMVQNGDDQLIDES